MAYSGLILPVRGICWRNRRAARHPRNRTSTAYSCSAREQLFVPARVLQRILSHYLNTAMTHRLVAPATLFIVALAFLAGCDSQSTSSVDASVTESLYKVSEVAPSEQEVFEVVETMPVIIGGLGSLAQRIKYPAVAKNAGLQGRVIVQFIVTKQGGVEDPVVVKGVGGELDEEALRVVRGTKFTPGMQSGSPVSVRMSIPINFKLDNS